MPVREDVQAATALRPYAAPRRANIPANAVYAGSFEFLKRALVMVCKDAAAS
jgi:hypothetical protein